MSTRYDDSALVTNKQYTVQDVPKFPSNKKFMIGKLALLVQVTNTTASVRFTNNLHEIPVRALFNIAGYTARSVHAKNADGFVIKCNNEFGIAIGTAFLEPDSVTDTHAVFTINGATLKLPLNILIALERNKVKVTKVKKIKSENGAVVPTTVVEAVAGAIQIPDISKLPSAVSKILPELNIPELITRVKTAPLECFDFNGNDHDTIEKAIIANSRFLHEQIQKIIIEEVNNGLNTKFEEIRDEELQRNP